MYGQKARKFDRAYLLISTGSLWMGVGLERLLPGGSMPWYAWFIGGFAVMLCGYAIGTRE